MSYQEPQRVTELRAVIHGFLQARCNDKLEAVKDDPDNPEAAIQQSDKLRQQFIPAVWLDDAARRAGQIQAVTHSLKPVHPDAKGTNLYSPPSGLAVLDVVGSHCLGEDFAGDVVGNAAALDVYKFLKQSHAGRSLLVLAVDEDADLSAALSTDPATAQDWMRAFAGLTQPRGRVASHTLAKQLYWPIAQDVHDDANFHLLSPLYASSLAHRVYERVQDDRFGDAAKAAREAKKANVMHDRPVHEYPHMAVQQLGGTKPQNISQLNSERRGNNHLLASLPPVWRSSERKPLFNTASMFLRYSRRPDVSNSLKALLKFLKTDPQKNMATRDRRAAYVNGLVDEFLQFTAELQELPPGWSQDPACVLPTAQARWLDPEGAAQADAAADRAPPTDVPERICEAFANWLNTQLQLRGALPVGDDEFLAWRKVMWDAIQAFAREESDAY